MRKGAGQGAGEGEGSGGHVLGLTEGRAVVRWPGDGGEGGGGESSGARSLGAQNWGKEEWWEDGMPGRPFMGLEGERGGRAMEGNGQW
jgi:hypothetical protein